MLTGVSDPLHRILNAERRCARHGSTVSPARYPLWGEPAKLQRFLQFHTKTTMSSGRNLFLLPLDSWMFTCRSKLRDLAFNRLQPFATRFGPVDFAETKRYTLNRPTHGLAIDFGMALQLSSGDRTVQKLQRLCMSFAKSKHRNNATKLIATMLSLLFNDQVSGLACVGCSALLTNKRKVAANALRDDRH